MRLQYTDFSRAVIVSTVPVLSEGCKEEGSLGLQDIHSVLLQQNEELQTEGQVENGGSTLRSSSLITIRHTGSRKQSAQQPVRTVLLQQRFITAHLTWNCSRDIRRRWGHEERSPQTYTDHVRLDTCTL